MKSKRSRLKNRQHESIVLLTALCGAGTAGAQETASTAADADNATTLPPQVVQSTQAPRPAPRPAPVPRPAPAPVVEVAPPPVIATDSLYQAEMLTSPKYTQPLLDTPRTVQVIPQALMEDQGATTLREALRNVSGISVQAGEGGGVPGDNISIRGFAARNDLFIDGIRDFGAYSRDPFNLEQIEVAKGPASTNTGRGSTGGSINLVTKTAKLNDFLHTDVSVGSDSLLRSTLDYNTPLTGIEGAALRLNVMGHENDTPGRDFVGNERWGVAGSLAFGLGEAVVRSSSGKSSYDKNGWAGKEPVGAIIPNDTRLYVNFFHFEENNVPDYGIPWVPDNISDPGLFPFIDKVAPVPYSNFYGNLRRDVEETQTTATTIRFEHDFNDSLTLRNQLRVGSTDRYSVATPPRFLTGSNPALIRGDNYRNRNETNSIIANQTDFVFSIETGPFQHDGVVGFEYIEEEFDRYPFSSRNTAHTDLFRPQIANAPLIPGPAGPTGDSTHSVATTAAAYLFDTVELTDWLEVSGGARYDNYETDYRSVDITGGTGITQLGRVDEVVSGQAAVVFKPAENGSVYFGWGTSFNPSGEALSLSDAATASNSIDVDPEINETFELGTKWNIFEEKLSVSSAVFQTTKTNARTQDPADPSAFTTLDGEQEIQGFEFGLAGKVAPWWEIYTSYTHLDSEITKSLDPLELGNETAHTPANTFSLWNNFDLPGKFFAGGGPVFVDSRYSNNENNRQAPSYTSWDAMIGYEMNENITLRVNVFNLADEDYVDRVGGGHVIPGAGRSVMFTVSGKF